MPTTTLTIALVDDHPLLAAALGTKMERAGALARLVDPAGGVEDILDSIDGVEPDAVVVDLGMPFPGGGQSLISPLVSRDIPVVVLTGEVERWQWAQAVQAGAAAVLSKTEPLDDIIDAVLRVARGETVRTVEHATLQADYERLARERTHNADAFETLSPREQEVLAGLMAGHSVKRLAERDYVSVQTVRTQVKSLLRKLNVGSQLEAVAMANAAGWKPSRVPR